MKFYKKYFSLKHWIAFFRRQPNHMQHVYAALFAGSITAVIAVAILYFDYGFWRERYSRTEIVKESVVKNSPQEVETVSPGEMMGGFFKEASARVQSIKNQKIELLQGKEVYSSGSTTIQNATGSTQK